MHALQQATHRAVRRPPDDPERRGSFQWSTLRRVRRCRAIVKRDCKITPKSLRKPSTLPAIKASTPRHKNAFLTNSPWGKGRPAFTGLADIPAHTHSQASQDFFQVLGLFLHDGEVGKDDQAPGLLARHLWARWKGG